MSGESSSSSSCCPPGSWDQILPIVPYQLKGIDISLRDDDLKAYYVSPDAGSSKGIIIFSDVWGVRDRTKSLCDTFAREGGYHVIMPDCFRGTSKEGQDDFLSWVKSYPYDTMISQDVKACLAYLKSKTTASSSAIASPSIGAVGFCWGAWVIAKVASSSSSSPVEGVGLTCGVGVHPSTKLESVAFDGDEEAMLKSVDIPLLLLPAGNDPENLKEGSDIVAHLETKGGGSFEYKNMIHGFVTRGDLNIDGVRKDSEDALHRTLEFLRSNL